MVGDVFHHKDIEAHCVIEVWDWERRIRQRVFIDLEMAADMLDYAFVLPPPRGDRR